MDLSRFEARRTADAERRETPSRQPSEMPPADMEEAEASYVVPTQPMSDVMNMALFPD